MPVDRLVQVSKIRMIEAPARPFIRDAGEGNRVFQRGERGYRGRFGGDRNKREQWRNAVPHLNDIENQQDPRRDRRRGALVAAGIGVPVTAAAVGTPLAIRRNNRKASEYDQMSAKLQRKISKAEHQTWHAEDPAIRHARTNRAGIPRVDSIRDKPGRLGEFGARHWNFNNAKAIGGLAAGTGLASLVATAPSRQNRANSREKFYRAEVRAKRPKPKHALRNVAIGAGLGAAATHTGLVGAIHAGLRAQGHVDPGFGRTWKKVHSREFVNQVMSHPGTREGYATALGTGALMGASVGAQHTLNRHEASERKALLGKRDEVTKKLEFKYIRHALSSPREFGSTVRRYPAQFAVGVGGVGLGGVVGSRDKNHRKAVASGGAAGAAGGQLAYYGAGFGALASAEKAKRRAQQQGHTYTDPKTGQKVNLKRSAQEAIWRNHRKSHGYHQGGPMTDEQAWKIFSQYPKKLPGWRQQRFAAHLQHGKRGLAYNAATTLGGAVLGGGAVHAHGRKQTPEKIGKALYAQEQRTSPVRALEAGAGLAVGGWGLGRSKMVGAALGRGLKLAEKHENVQALRALQYAQAAQGALARGTAPMGRTLRQIRIIDEAVNAVPAAIRPDVAAAAGILLTTNAHPVRRTSYRPVGINMRIRSS